MGSKKEKRLFVKTDIMRMRITHSRSVSLQSSINNYWPAVHNTAFSFSRIVLTAPSVPENAKPRRCHLNVPFRQQQKRRTVNERPKRIKVVIFSWKLCHVYPKNINKFSVILRSHVKNKMNRELQRDWTRGAL